MSCTTVDTVSPLGSKRSRHTHSVPDPDTRHDGLVLEPRASRQDVPSGDQACGVLWLDALLAETNGACLALDAPASTPQAPCEAGHSPRAMPQSPSKPLPTDVRDRRCALSRNVASRHVSCPS